jgi:hypothetical protein
MLLGKWNGEGVDAYDTIVVGGLISGQNGWEKPVYYRSGYGTKEAFSFSLAK